jgi:hypothetical protein
VSIPPCRRRSAQSRFFLLHDRYLNGYTNWKAGLEGKDRVHKYGQTIGLTHEIGYSLVSDTRRSVSNLSPEVAP